MASAERRTIDELVTRYELEPTLKDIYVEGAQDKRIVDALLQEHQITGVSVFEISSVDISAASIEGTGNRTRLVKLATALLESLGSGKLRLACVIDSDFDYLTGSKNQNAFLLSTDYADMEMYFFSPAAIAKMSRHCLSARGVTEHMRKAFMEPTLQLLFRISYVNSRPTWRLKALSFERLVSLKKGRFAFDSGKYIQRYLEKNARSAQRSQFEREVGDVALPAALDARCFMHGHDSLTLLRKMLRSLGYRRLGSEVKPRHQDLLFSMLRRCADYPLLAQEPLFAEILQRFA